ncbi:spermatogenesis-associated protein 7 isoform X1 [Physeter macrocephalus]|uniref:Spermatogenesis-associated protein 7 isoform X1 n=3 Tax=Physeter macrocephalus TaxID=9755 RepID=A0A2Y9EPL2_PHYMC|nr:spermatogenesis-associated protein 7 isoform X1 [Physeter catodon]|eukprot:XP_007105745.1 spermatogenesis-associated protein 7 isoform X2 [Physeter catodon]
MDGSRRVRATSVLPRYGPPCLFKGHLSTKSNAFCTDSSSLRLSTLQLVKNHMAVHYNKILSAKAAVDCSVPLSMSASIKYADQQRREKLKKELAWCERELKLTKTAMQSNCKSNSKSLLNTLQKPPGEPQDEDAMLIEEVNGFPSFKRSPVTSSERLHLNPPKSGKVLTNGTEKNSSSFLSSMDYVASRPRKSSSGTSYGRGPRGTSLNSQRFQLVISKAPSGDLLDKHSELFSNRHLPFTPRTLKTEAKSFLSQYRYYTPAKRKKDFTDQQIEAETQTELSSFQSDFETVEIKNFTDSQMNIKQASSCMSYGTKGKITPLPLQGHELPWDEVKDSALQCSSSRAVCQCSLQPPSGRKIYSDEEELLYLSFIEDVTDEILKLGLFSNRFLERLFERHIEQNKHHLEEEKMRHLLHILKVDLGCMSKENSVMLDDVGMLHLLDFEKAENSEQNEYKNEQDLAIQQERQEYQKALTMLLSVPKDENKRVSSPNEFFLPVYKSKYSEGVKIQQVNDETNLGTSVWDEKNVSMSNSLLDQETSVNVIEGDSDNEEVETSDELCCFSTALSPSVQLCSVKDGNQDMEGPTLKIMEMSIED